MSSRSKMRGIICAKLLLGLMISAGPASPQAIIIDHSCTDLPQIPASVIHQIKNDTRMLYGHTSHGSQPTTGLLRIEGGSAFYSVAIYSNDLPDEPGAFCIWDPGRDPQTYFTYTPSNLNSRPSVNYSMFSWCSEQNYNSHAETQAYLNNMEALESAYPGVTFIYMTGNAQAGGSAGYNRYQRNNQIRDFCEARGKVLFDFADLDCWYQGDLYTYDYEGHAVPQEHPQFSGDEAGHTTYESCEIKGAAVWWMMARLLGWEPDGPGDPVRLVTGPGPGPFQLPGIRGYSSGGDPVSTCDFTAYAGVSGYGGLVAGGDFTGNLKDDILTGPGPGPGNPPRVRAFNDRGEILAGLDFLAYGVNKYGVRITAAHLSAGEREQILTAPGPGAIFGPHVRGWTYEDNGITALPGLNFIAYGTKKWGADVAAGHVDGSPADEIITGAGAGPIFGPHVRGWTYSDGQVTAMGPHFSFMAYGTSKWGVRVATGDLDGDGFDEVLTTPGPGPIFGPHVRGWNFDAASVSPLPGCSYFAYARDLKYGCLAAGGDISGHGGDEILTGPGPGSVYSGHVRGWQYGSGTVSAMDTVNFPAYEDLGYRFGVNVAILKIAR